MILIGQYDSPFVRRVGIALRIYDLPFEHRALSVFENGDAIRAINPLMRVPTLVLDDGFVLTDSHIILDYLDSLVAVPLFPRQEPARRSALRIATLACGAAEKAVSLFYERRLHTLVSTVWSERCALQVNTILTSLEAERRRFDSGWWFGDTLGHADIAMACALRFIADAHPGLIDQNDLPCLFSDLARAESLAIFREIYQGFIPPT